jgi:plasmid maintenance system antidote protein VapI
MAQRLNEQQMHAVLEKARNGSIRKLAATLHVTDAYIGQMLAKKTPISEGIAAKLGYRRIGPLYFFEKVK